MKSITIGRATVVACLGAIVSTASVAEAIAQECQIDLSQGRISSGLHDANGNPGMAWETDVNLVPFSLSQGDTYIVRFLFTDEMAPERDRLNGHSSVGGQFCPESREPGVGLKAPA